MDTKRGDRYKFSATQIGSENVEVRYRASGVQSTSPEVAAATAAFSKDGMLLFQSLIATMVVAALGWLGARTAEEQEWCFGSNK